jgi:hypothetical protein
MGNVLKHASQGPPPKLTCRQDSCATATEEGEGVCGCTYSWEYTAFEVVIMMARRLLLMCLQGSPETQWSRQDHRQTLHSHITNDHSVVEARTTLSETYKKIIARKLTKQPAGGAGALRCLKEKTAQGCDMRHTQTVQGTSACLPALTWQQETSEATSSHQQPQGPMPKTPTT